MNKFFYLTIFNLFSFALLYYLLSSVLTPYGEDYLLIVKNVFIVDGLLLISFSSLFGLIHSILDKLFFLKFYEKPRIYLGIRRGVVLTLAVLSILNLKIFGINETYAFILVVILALLIELLFILVEKNRKEKNKLVKQNITNPS